MLRRYIFHLVGIIYMRKIKTSSHVGSFPLNVNRYVSLNYKYKNIGCEAV